MTGRTPTGRPSVWRLVTRLVIGLAPALFALACLLDARPHGAEVVATTAALALLYLLAFRTEFRSSRGSAVPTQSVLVGMYMAVPAMWIPAVVLLASFVGSAGDLRDEPWWWRALLASGGAWNIIAPVCVLVAFREHSPGTSQAVVIGIAVAAQLAWDAVNVLGSALVAHELGEVVQPLRWMLGVDAMLAVIGYCIVDSTGPGLPWLLLVGVPALLMRLVSDDRATVFERAESLEVAVTEAEQESRRDAMTGLLNRRGWDDALGEAEATILAEHPTGAVAVLMADLDGLKAVNDTSGHPVGDAMICAFADLLRRAAPEGAVVARLGGDEFAALVTATDAERLPDILGSVQHALTHAPPSTRFTLSASLGLASCPPAHTLQEAVVAADHAARLDKEARRVGREHHPRVIA